jgi:hypothetical protein
MSFLAQNGFENPEWALLLNMGLRHALGMIFAQPQKFVGFTRSPILGTDSFSWVLDQSYKFYG